ncbi:hypothetical protein B0H21DRAFT_738280 [Amylocystis lapponica]|nr:hypothetical protein B0H21DRAFT_738280 [Amylocystis lapponica]
MASGSNLTSSSDDPEVQAHYTVTESPELALDFAELLRDLSIQDNESRRGCCLESIKKADKFVLRSYYEEARYKYRQAITAVVGDDFTIPLTPAQGGGVRSDVYLGLTIDETISLMACCNGMAICMVGAKEIGKALDWLEEVNVLWKHVHLSKRPPLSDYPQRAQRDLLTQRLVYFSYTLDLFYKLGNTASAAHRQIVGNELRSRISADVDTRPLGEILPVDSIPDLSIIRHPTPTIVGMTRLTQPSLQVRGSWQKISVPRASSISHRTNFASFIYKSHLYVAGGYNLGTSREPFRDLWCMDLKKLDGWRELAPYPADNGDAVAGWHMLVHGGKAYLFKGKPILDYFDLVTERWGQLHTSLADDSPWPYKRFMVSACTEQVVRGRLFVFSGGVNHLRVGCTLLMALDFRTKKWTRLSASLNGPKPLYFLPGPRTSLSSWVDSKQDRIYIKYGIKNRYGAMQYDQVYGSQDSYTYDDCWSWGIREQEWRQERMVGNVPCPRAEFSCAYNPKLDATVLFGGYNQQIPDDTDSSSSPFNFSYYADAFILDHSSPTPTWKQVLAQGFPTYRAAAHLHADPDTGRTFLFGGHTNTMFVPSGKHEDVRSFSDLWQLRLDVPGGFIEEVDWEEEMRTAPMGPWHKCFSCGSAGPWKKCSGTCRGRVFFCDMECMRKSWQEHREKHGCAKWPPRDR